MDIWLIWERTRPVHDFWIINYRNILGASFWNWDTERKEADFGINWSLATEICTRVKSKKALWENIFTKSMLMFILFYGIIFWQVNYDILHFFYIFILYFIYIWELLCIYWICLWCVLQKFKGVQEYMAPFFMIRS